MRRQSRNRMRQRNWAEILCLGCTCLQLFWGRVVMRKWLNIPTKESDYSADTDSGSDSDFSIEDAVPRLRRRKSETFRAQYINTKEIKVCAATWNAGGRIPPADLDLEGWLDVNEPADMYVIGFQEIIPLNASNIFGAEDNRPVSIWEDIIRETLNKIPPVTKFKCYSDPPSPSRFKPSEDAPDIEDEIALETDSDSEEEIYPVDGELMGLSEARIVPLDGEHEMVTEHASVSSYDANLGISVGKGMTKQFSSPKSFDRLNCFRAEEYSENVGESNKQYNRKLSKTLSGTEKVGFCWPEQPLDLLSHRILERPNSFKSMKSCKASKSFQKYSSFKFSINADNRTKSDAALLVDLDLESLIKQKRRPSYVRIISKQMVGIFLTIWVRRNLRKHIQNLSVSTVGVGAMGYIGNKGSISVSMSVYQTLFCFICTHLTSGEKGADVVKRNADVQEILRRTHFNSLSNIGLPKQIHDHEKYLMTSTC